MNPYQFSKGDNFKTSQTLLRGILLLDILVVVLYHLYNNDDH